MSSYEQLLKQCILGTGQHPPQTLNDTDPQLQTVLSQLPEGSPEQQVLAATSVLSHYQQAGTLPWQTMTIPSASENESQAFCSVRAARLIQGFIVEQDGTLLKQAAKTLIANKQILPAQLLPGFLDLCANQRPMQNLAFDIIGKRGHWLCRMNPDWSFSTDSNYDWQLSQGVKRQAQLQQLRKQSPEDTRTAIQNIWSTESAKERLNMLEAMDQCLNQLDLPFLKAQEKDRSQAVRVLAAQQRAKLGDEALSQSVIATIAHLFEIRILNNDPNTPEVYRFGDSNVLLPKAFDPAWQAWGLQEKSGSVWAGGKKVGQKAGWFYHLLKLVDPVLLAKALHVELNGLIVILDKSENPLLLGALDIAARNTANCDYLKLRWERLDKAKRVNWLTENLQGYPVSALQTLLNDAITDFDTNKQTRWADMLYMVVSFARYSDEPFDGDFSCKLLELCFNKRKAQKKNDWRVNQWVDELGFYLDIASHDWVKAFITSQSDPNLHFQTLLTRYQQRVDFFKEFIHE